MQKKKNLRLLILFGILLIWTIIFAGLEKNPDRIAVDETLFAVADTASITHITIIKKDETIELKRYNENWRVNDQYDLDPSMKKVLLAVLHEVRIQRSVPKKNKQEFLEELDVNGIQIEIKLKNGDNKNFTAGGNGISVSYFTEDLNDLYVVNLPGYESYVTGIFEVNENDWRDRLLYQISMLRLTSFSITYTDAQENGLFIEPDGTFYKVKGVAKPDTAALTNYLEQHRYFFVDQYISGGQIPVYDSLLQTKPFAEFSVDVMGFDSPFNIKFFPGIEKENVLLGVINDRDLGLFQKDRMNELFKFPNDFKK